MWVGGKKKTFLPLQAGLKKCKAVKKPRMTLLHRCRRLRWCQGWKSLDFRNVVFSDEKRWCRLGDGPTKVWRRDGERFVQRFMSPTTKFKGGSVMVWGCISYDGPGHPVSTALPASALVLLSAVLITWTSMNISKFCQLCCTTCPSYVPA